jgi:drug/metabolite transporter (DMT)-like permease
MPTHVLLIVLFAALLHASWNAIVKSGNNKLLEAAMVATGAGLVAGFILPFLPLPATASWPWLAASVVIHQLYFVMVAAAYQAGDMGHTYPLMRGSAPLLVAFASAPLLGEVLTATSWAGIGLICGGILLLALHGKADKRATLIALGNAIVIALYTLIDGTGVRLSGHALSYVLWLHLLTGIPLLIWLWRRNAAVLKTQIQTRGLLMFAGGVCTVGSYGLALWAMTQAPLATVAALRETSVLFAVAISALVLREGNGLRRLATGVLVVAGAATLKLA